MAVRPSVILRLPLTGSPAEVVPKCPGGLAGPQMRLKLVKEGAVVQLIVLVLTL